MRVCLGVLSRFVLFEIILESVRKREREIEREREKVCVCVCEREREREKRREHAVYFDITSLNACALHL